MFLTTRIVDIAKIGVRKIVDLISNRIFTLTKLYLIISILLIVVSSIKCLVFVTKKQMCDTILILLMSGGIF